MSGLRRLKAPSEDGGILAEPALAEVGRLLEENRRRLAAPVEIFGRPLADLQQQARREAVAQARRYLDWVEEPVPSFDHRSLILAGHQPELMHAGVWIKNFALHGLAKRHGLTPLNLVVDHDTVKTTSLRLPAREDGKAFQAIVSFAEWTGEAPYEEWRVLERDQPFFARFPERARAILSDWGLNAILPDFWKESLGSSIPWLSQYFARGRRIFERRWGCHNLELPTSLLCQTPAFAWFAGHILHNIARFHEVHNTALAEYRRAHGIKSRNHPVPELVREGVWWETPFWGWRYSESHRGRLMVRFAGDQFELRADKDLFATFPTKAEVLVERWQELTTWDNWSEDRKVRCRALTTTLFARLFLGDLFIHGIGGGKYDELTDVIIRRFYGIEPPAYLVLSGTLHLPLPVHPVNRDDRPRLIRQVRDLHYNPQRNGAGNPRVQALAASKQAWIDQQPAEAAGRRFRFQAIRAINEQLRPLVADQEAAARQRLASVEAQLHDNAILQRRDYPACLFPEAKLRPFLTQFLDG